jgi:Flp pilus assembly protein TadG
MSNSETPEGRGRRGGLFRRFRRDKRGAFAMQFALMVVPLVVCTGLAIDGGRTFLARYELESALDAAALAVGSSTGNQATMDALARRYVDTNFKAPDTTQVSLTVTPTTSMVTVRGETQLSTYFMPLVGIPRVTIRAESEVRRGGSNVEVALMLDITESMLTNDRIGSLRTAANSLIDTVVSDQQTPFFSRVSIVPWANNVHAGAYAPAIRGAAGGTAVTAATWRASGPYNISAVTWKITTATVTAASWRNGAASVVSSGATNGPKWQNGTAVNGTAITKIASNRIQVTINTGTFVDGDFVYITNANGGYTSLNTNIYRVASRTGTTFVLQNATASTYPTNSTSSAGTAITVQECFSATCQWRITTAAAHNIANNDYVIIQSVASGLNTSSTVPVQIPSTLSTTTFLVPGTTPSSPSSISYSGTGGSVQRCFGAGCPFQLTTQAAHGIANNDYVRIGSVLTGIDSTGTSPVQITNVTSTTTFMVPGTTLATVGTTAYTGTNGRVWECLTSTCPLRVTATGNDFANNDRIFIADLTMTPAGLNNSNGATWSISNVDSVNGTFILPGTSGLNYTDFVSGGTATKCFGSTCPIQITAAGHGFSDNDKIYITGMAGMDVNTSGDNYRTVTSATTNTFILSGLVGQNFGDWTGSGTVWCLNQGCEYYRYTNTSGSDIIRQISNCVTERVGAERYTDAAPTGANTLGDDYPASGYNTCDTANNIQPLTSNKTTLHGIINGMDVTGSTAGHIGVAWGWYMLSPNWTTVWPAGESQPHAYGEQYLRKVAVLMTDGDFNTAHCNGVVSNNYGFGSNSEEINCGASPAPYTQATALCTAMKAQGITIYTVGFEITANSAPDNFMRGCATSTAHYYLASNGTELQTAFANIAAAISRLRISR